jgi:endonuclease/exonuclease/phosphatase family metal-dependent hydrolase
MATLRFPTIRIATWNVQEGRDNGRDVTLAGNASALHAALEQVRGVDVLALQEVPFSDAGESRFLDELRTGSPLEHLYTETLSPSMFDAREHSGLAIVSTVPLAPVHFAALPNPELIYRWGADFKRTFDKGMIAATLNWHGMELTVGSLHSFPFHRFGRAANDPEFGEIWAVLARQIEELPYANLAVCGDFNTEVRDLVLRRLRRPLARTFLGVLTSREFEFDDMLRSPALKLASQPRAVATFSDHKLCVADFTFVGDVHGL